MSVILRDWPYPYRAALTISNDADCMQWQTFLDIHTYLNTDRDTPMGKGLALEIADSFFPFTEDTNREFSYFVDFEGKKSRCASQIRDIVQAGYIDTLHTYGDFDEIIRFNRRFAEIAINEFVKENIWVEVWTNHGKVNNVQNIGGSTGYYHHGDLPHSSAYHTDLTTQYGVKYYWNDTVLIREFALRKETTHLPLRLLRKEPKLVLIEKLLNRIFSRKTARLVAQHVRAPALYGLHVLRDGNRMLNFVRFRYSEMLPYAPHAHNLELQLSAKNIDRLIKRRAVCVIYQHLGVWRDTKGTIKYNHAPYFNGEQIGCLEKVRQLENAGILFVTGLRRLLNYIHVVNYLRYRVIWEKEWYRIVMLGIECPITGRRSLSKDEMQGVTFYTPNPGKTEIYLDGEVLPLDKENNEKDETGRKSVSVKWLKAQWPL